MVLLFVALDEFTKQPKNVSAAAYDWAVIVCDHNRREGVGQ